MTDQYSGRELCPNDDPRCDRRAYDYFMCCFPKKQLQDMVSQTNEKLSAADKGQLTTGELLKWLGITLLMTRFEFGERASLWNTESTCKYIAAPAFGEKTGMSRDRYTEILRFLVWSHQPAERPRGISHEEWRWMLVEDHKSNFNDHRKQYFHPGWQLCVDESISRWYGLGGHWINMGLPMYVAMDRKPEDGLEIQNMCCALSGIMCRLKLVKSAASNAEE